MRAATAIFMTGFSLMAIAPTARSFCRRARRLSQLNIMDAGFALSHEGRQYNLRASKEMLGDRLALTVGPLTVEIVKPMHETCVHWPIMRAA